MNNQLSKSGQVERYKVVEFSYPTSPNAKRFGFYHNGCWTVEVECGIGREIIQGFETQQAAIDYANELVLDWYPAYIKQGRKTA